MDFKVFIASGEAACSEIGEDLGHHAWITLVEDKGAVCLSCADLDHLVFLPSGDAALTRRSAKYSTLRAIVLKWSKARKRYERQGQLIEEEALQRAEEECLADADMRARRRERDAERREQFDQAYIARLLTVLGSPIQTVHPDGNTSSQNTPAKNTAEGWAVQPALRYSMKRRSPWQSSHMPGMSKPVMTPCSHRDMTALTPESWSGIKSSRS